MTKLVLNPIFSPLLGEPGSCFLTEQCLVSNVMVDGCVSGMRPVAVCGAAAGY